MEFLMEYGIFFAKLITIIIGIGFVVAMIVGAVRSRDSAPSGTLQVVHLNRRLQRTANQLKSVVLTKKELKEERKREKKEEKAKKKAKKGEQKKKPIVYVLDFHGDIQATQVKHISRLISALLEVVKPRQEVVLRLESAGGMVHSYGLAAAQLLRLKEHKLSLTVCVDKVAASGGYMMAAVADKICAAPFAVVGSIGVIGMIPNIHRLLKENKVDIEQHTAGEYKRTLTLLGQNTPKGRAKFKKDLTRIHELFKSLLKEHRSQLPINKVATGEVWYGTEAQKLKLVDEIVTSDEYLLQKCKTAEVYMVRIKERKKLDERLSKMGESLLDRLSNKILYRLSEWRLFRQ